MAMSKADRCECFLMLYKMGNMPRMFGKEAQKDFINYSSMKCAGEKTR